MKKAKLKSCNDAPAKNTPVKHRLCELFWTLSPGFTRWAESHMHEEGLTPQRLRLMWFLHEDGPMMMSSLSDELGVTATNVTAMVDALEKDGMVARKRHPTDRRATMITLTAKAEKRIEENCVQLKDRVSEVFSVFSKAEQEQFLGHLLRMRSAFVERGILEESDSCTQSADTKRKAKAS